MFESTAIRTAHIARKVNELDAGSSRHIVGELTAPACLPASNRFLACVAKGRADISHQILVAQAFLSSAVEFDMAGSVCCRVVGKVSAQELLLHVDMQKRNRLRDVYQARSTVETSLRLEHRLVPAMYQWLRSYINKQIPHDAQAPSVRALICTAATQGM